MIHPLRPVPAKAQNLWFDRQMHWQKHAMGKPEPKVGDKFFAYGLEKPGFLKAALLEPLTESVIGVRCTSKLFPMIPHKPSNVIMVAKPDHGERVIGVTVKLKSLEFGPLLDLYGGADEVGLCFIRVLPYRTDPQVISFLEPEGAWCIMSRWLMPGKHYAELKAPPESKSN